MSYTTLAHVSTGDLATAALQNAMIDDLAVLKTSIADDGTINPSVLLTKPELKNYFETKNTVAIAAGVLSLDLSLGCEFDVTLNANITSITFSNYPSSTKWTTVTIRFTADGTIRTITWPAAFHWASGTTPSMTGTNAKVDIITARTPDGGTNWYPAVYGQNM